jgi:hypothetical protein
MKKQIQKVKLVYTDGVRSNKEYNVKLFEVLQGYKVECSYGKRYQASNHSSKTINPVSYNAALNIYNNVITQKIRKGYEIYSHI